ncbi:MAG TPA: carboxypeptidase regulatory-like domain-containing protein [Thiotrichaceae bacterium]|nr:carboxypeptidase regulatory-like domain-containing protein [Thiotrichaceae bacterium]
MIKRFIYTANSGPRQWRLLLGIICLLGWHGVMANDPSMYAEPALDVEVIAAELLTVSSSRTPNDEALFITFEVGEDYLFYPPVSASFFLYVGKFKGYSSDILPIWLEEKQSFQITELFFNWEQFEEEAPIILTKLGGESLHPEIQQAFMTSKTPRFSHSIVVDKRGRVISGWVCYQKTLYELNYLPGAIVNIHGGSTSLSLVADEKGEFSLYDGNGLYLEDGQEYQVEVIVDGVTVLSQIITKENSDYPNWALDPSPNHFSEISGYVSDITGEPLAGVTLTAGNHTTTSNEKGYYQLNHLVVGATYALEASKEDYHFSPVEFTVGSGQPVNIDLVEKNPTQCLLYAVHDTAKSEAQLLTVDW